jgi:hypothetical protein
MIMITSGSGIKKKAKKKVTKNAVKSKEKPRATSTPPKKFGVWQEEVGRVIIIIAKMPR